MKNDKFTEESISSLEKIWKLYEGIKNLREKVDTNKTVFAVSITEMMCAIVIHLLFCQKRRKEKGGWVGGGNSNPL